MKDKPARAAAQNDKIICTCNRVRRSTLEAAISRGCNTLPKIYSVTTAGIGECGGTCRPRLAQILEEATRKKSNSGN